MKSITLSEIQQQRRRTAKTLYDAGFSYESVCESCGKRQGFSQDEFAECLVHGFPRCCDLTMTLRTKKRAEGAA